MNSLKAWLSPIQRLADTLPLDYQRDTIELAESDFLRSIYDFENMSYALDATEQHGLTKNEKRLLKEERRRQVMFIAARALKYWDALEEEK